MPRPVHRKIALVLFGRVVRIEVTTIRGGAHMKGSKQAPQISTGAKLNRLAIVANNRQRFGVAKRDDRAESARKTHFVL